MKKFDAINNQKMGGDKGGELSTMNEVRGLIHKIRGKEVMLDADLARIYGYTTKAFNQQVMRNIEKFEGEEFMFRLTWEELESILRCQNGTSKLGIVDDGDCSRCQNGTLNIEGGFSRSQIVTLKSDSRGNNIKYLPYAFTEQGVYMLMTVLRGELAVKQSRALVMAFKAMKDFILENRMLVAEREDLKMMALVAENSQQVGKIEKCISAMNKRLTDIEEKVENTVMRNEVAPIMLDFSKFVESREYLFMENELMEAKDVYQSIYLRARKSIHIIDDYIDIRTLRLLGCVRKGVVVTIFSDNVKNHLHNSDYLDFRREFPGVRIRFVKTCNSFHDRFVIVDLGEKNEVIYHCRASSKDAGRAVTMIMNVDGELAVESMHMVVERLMKNPELRLR